MSLYLPLIWLAVIGGLGFLGVLVRMRRHRLPPEPPTYCEENMAKAVKELSSMDTVLIWKALRKLGESSDDPVERRDCERLLRYLRAKEARAEREQ